MDKRLYAVVAVGVLFSGVAHAVDCQQLPAQLRSECERITEEDLLRVKLACRQLKLAHERAQRLGGSKYQDAEDRASIERDLDKCAQESPSLFGLPTPAAGPVEATPAAFTRGLAALNEGDFDAAIAEFSAAITDNPKDPFSYIRRGMAYEKKGDTASAIADYRDVMKLVDADTGAVYAAKIRKLEKTKK
jgi:Flp pilus assembly protein TadD